MHSDIEFFSVPQGSTIGDAALKMDRNGLGVVLVINGERHLLDTITDGDLRRAMLAHIDLSQPVTVLTARKARSGHAKPITASIAEGRDAHLRILQEHTILHLPILDERQCVVGLVTLDEFVSSEPPIQAVIMAGGRGTRLYPLTEQIPKPMLPVGDRPLLELIVEQLRDAGIKRVNLATHHHSQKIAEHFGDGVKFGVEMTYVTEDRPLGTAGGLGLMKLPTETTLVINGDILTQVNFQAMLAFHRAHGAELTVAVRKYDVQVPFGVIESDGAFVRSLKEKPALNFFINAGIYLLEPSVYSHLSCGERCDMTDLIQTLLDRGRPVVGFPIREYWLDIGQPNDYEQAQSKMKDWKPEL